MSAIATAGSKVLILIGAGVTGTYIVNNTHLSELLSDLTKVFSKHLKDSNDGAGGDVDGNAAALSAQVRRLTQELKYLSSMQSRPIVVNSSSDTRSVFSTLLPVAGLGALGYAYMKWKGISFGDLMYVTRRGMNMAVDNFNKQMEGLTTALANAKKQLSLRLDSVSKTVNETAALTGIVKDELLETKSHLGLVGDNVGLLQNDMVDVKESLSSLESKQDFANQGIVLLCRFVVDGIQGDRKPELLEGLNNFTRSGRTISSNSNAGLKVCLLLFPVCQSSSVHFLYCLLCCLFLQLMILGLFWLSWWKSSRA